jgi:hypothetical protein
MRLTLVLIFESPHNDEYYTEYDVPSFPAYLDFPSPWSKDIPEQL